MEFCLNLHNECCKNQAIYHPRQKKFQVSFRPAGVCALFRDLGEMDLQRNHTGSLFGGGLRCSTKWIYYKVTVFSYKCFLGSIVWLIAACFFCHTSISGILCYTCVTEWSVFYLILLGSSDYVN